MLSATLQRIARDGAGRARRRARALRDGTGTVSLGGRGVGQTLRVRRGRSVLTARVVDTFDAWALRDGVRDLVADTLAAHGIAHRVMTSPDASPHRVVVSGADAERVAAALPLLAGPDGPGDASVHIARVGPRGVGTARPTASAPGARPGEVLRIFLAQVSTSGRLLATHDLGVDLELWTPTSRPRTSPDGPALPAGTLLPPRLNPFVRSIAPGALAAPPQQVPPPALEQVTFPVDVVYTWVDSSDASWQADLAAARSGQDTDAAHASAAAAARYLSRDELRYSLRSIAAYASWVRTIHVVTNGQVPPWLDLDHPQIRLVRHEQIFPDPTDLPTFNSHAIEATLHRIPGLAPHYLYLNDDVLLARPLRPEHFFTGGGLLRSFPSMIPVDDRPVSPSDLPVVAAMKNGQSLIEEHFGRRPLTRPRHTPHPQRLDVAADLESACPGLVRRTRAARFRSPGDISFAAQLQAWWAGASGRGIPADTRYEFIDLAAPDADARIERLLVRADLDCYCLNETDTVDPEQAARRVERVLTTLLPFRSPYEVTS